MEQGDGSDPRGNKRMLFHLLLIAVGGILLVTLIVAIGIGIGVPEIYVRNGAWGDFFGGVFNPILTFVTFLAVLYTLYLQKDELSLTRAEMKNSTKALEHQADLLGKQTFENTFFQMLAMHNEIVSAIEVNGDSIRGERKMVSDGDYCENNENLKRSYLSGEALKSANKCKGMTNHLISRFDENFSFSSVGCLFVDAGVKGVGRGAFHEIFNHFKFFEKAYVYKVDGVQKYHLRIHALNHYFRYMYNIIKFVQVSPYKDGPYIKLLRAQISDMEMLVMFYSCLSEEGGPFKDFIEQTAFFNNLPFDLLLDPKHRTLYKETAYSLPEAK